LQEESSKSFFPALWKVHSVFVCSHKPFAHDRLAVQIGDANPMQAIAGIPSISSG
jgi:hypothetical protein